jgi:hypothetical protein
MRKSELVKRFRATHTMHGYRLEYTDYKKTWFFYTPYKSHYIEVSESEDLTTRELRGYIRLIKSQNISKVF